MMYNILNILLNACISITLWIIFYYLVKYYKIKFMVLKGLKIYKIFLFSIAIAGLSRLLKAISYILGDNIDELVFGIDFLVLISAFMFMLVLPTYMRRILLYKTPEEYELMTIKLQESIEKERKTLLELQIINHKLSDRLQTLENLIYNQGWLSEQQLKLSELRTIVMELKNQYNIKKD